MNAAVASVSAVAAVGRRRTAFDLAVSRATGGLLLAAGGVASAVPGDQGIPCPLRTLTGVPCPFCGMTTGVTATLRGDVGDALAANPLSVVVVVVAVFAVVGAFGRIRWQVPTWTVVFAVGALWLFELLRFGVL